MKKKTNLFDVCNVIFFIIITLIWIYPLWYVVVASFSTPAGYYADPYHVIPKSFTLDNFRYIMLDKSVFKAFGVSFRVTAIGTLLSIFLTAMAGYCLSKDHLPGIHLIYRLIILSMYISGGTVPMYLLVTNLHLKNTIWALILPGIIGTFNMILARNYFLSLPDSLEEAAKIDGATEFGVFLRIIIPLSKPILATLSLYYIVGYWNAYLNAILYMTDADMFTLPVILRSMLNNAKKEDMNQVNAARNSFREGMNMATVLITIVPILMIYPFLQKYFVKGVMVGAVKG